MSATTRLTASGAAVTCRRMGKRVSQKDKAEFAQKFKEWRERRNLTQEGAATWLGVPVATLRNWEIGRTMPANSHLILRLLNR